MKKRTVDFYLEQKTKYQAALAAFMTVMLLSLRDFLMAGIFFVFFIGTMIHIYQKAKTSKNDSTDEFP